MPNQITLSSLIPVLSHKLEHCSFGTVSLEIVVHDSHIVKWRVTDQGTWNMRPAAGSQSPGPPDNV